MNNRRQFLTISGLSLTTLALARVVSAAPKCQPQTPADIEGPYYKPGAPNNSNLQGSVGEVIVVSGSVRDKNCRLISGAILDIWHASHDGSYDQKGFAHRGKVATNQRGIYVFRTIKPGRYLNGNTFRPAHIHVKLSKPGYQGLTTQLYFSADPYNKVDPWFKPELVLNVRPGPSGCTLPPERMRQNLRANFDFVI